MKEIERFLTKIDKNTGSGCWAWKASKTQQGYGMFSYQGKSIPAHRFSYLHHKEKSLQDISYIKFVDKIRV